MKKLNLLIIIMFISFLQALPQENIKLNKKLMMIKKGIFDYKSYVKTSVPNEKSLVAISDYGNAPSWNWSEDFGGTSSDVSEMTAFDNSGNIIITGKFSGEMSFGNTTLNSVGINDAFVAKINPSGELLWFKQLSSSVNHEILSYGLYVNNDEIYITGYYTGSVTIGNYTLPDKNDKNLFFARLNSTGAVTFAANFENSSSSNGLVGCKIINKENSIYVLAQQPVYSAINFRNPAKLLKFKQDGTFSNAFSTDENIMDFTIADSIIYFVGTINDDGYIGDIYFNPVSFNDAYIAQCDTNLTVHWAWMAKHQNNGDSQGLGVFVDENSNLFFSGTYRGDIKLGDTLLYVYGYSFLTNLSDTTHFFWAKNISSTLKRFITGNNSTLLLNSTININTGTNNILSEVNPIDGSTYLEKTMGKAVAYCSFGNANNAIFYSGSNNGLVFLTKADNNLNDVWNFNTTGDSGNGWVISTETDNMNNIYTYGYASADMAYFNQSLEKGLFLSKQKPDGQIVWINHLPELKVMPDIGVYTTLDPSNDNIFITGHFFDSFILPNGEKMIPAENGSIFIIEFSVGGTFIKATKLDIQGNRPLCLNVDGNENIILTSEFQYTLTINGIELTSYGFDDIFIVKLSMDNELSWVIQAGGEDMEYPGFTSLDSDNNIYFTGEFNSQNVAVGDSLITLEEGDGNIILAKISPNGEVKWIKATAKSSLSYGDWYCWPTGIATNNDGSFYIKGWHGDSTYFGNYLLTTPYVFSKFIAKFDSTGNCLWANNIIEHHQGTDYNKMAVDLNGNVYFGMTVYDTIDFGDDFEYVPVGGGDMFIAKYLSDGSLNWVKAMHGVGNNYFGSVSVFDSTVTAGGYFTDSLSFGDESFVSYCRHGFLAQCGKDYNGFNEVYNKNRATVKIYPNPFNDKTTLSFENKDKSNYTLKIFNISGQQVREIQNIHSDKVILKKEQLKKGLYLVELNGKKNYSGKLFIQ